MAVVNRMRRSVTEQLERLATTETPAVSEAASLSSVESLIGSAIDDSSVESDSSGYVSDDQNDEAETVEEDD